MCADRACVHEPFPLFSRSQIRMHVVAIVDHSYVFLFHLLSFDRMIAARA